MTVRAIGKVANAYKRDCTRRRAFNPHGAFPYDDRLLSFKTDDQHVSIWALDGRQRVGYRCSARQRVLLEADLGLIGGAFYL